VNGVVHRAVARTVDRHPPRPHLPSPPRPHLPSPPRPQARSGPRTA